MPTKEELLAEIANLSGPELLELQKAFTEAKAKKKPAKKTTKKAVKKAVKKKPVKRKTKVKAEVVEEEIVVQPPARVMRPDGQFDDIDTDVNVQGRGKIPARIESFKMGPRPNNFLTMPESRAYRTAADKKIDQLLSGNLELTPRTRPGELTTVRCVGCNRNYQVHVSLTSGETGFKCNECIKNRRV